MTSPFFERRVREHVVRAWVTDRSIGSVHPGLVDAETLLSRQRAVTGHVWTMTDQVHGVDVVDADTSRVWAPTSGLGDVVVTREIDRHISVWAGDCAPIVLAADDGTLVGAHGGWRGLAAGVIDVAVGEVTARGGAVEVALLGPVIHPCCYEFGRADMAAVADGLGVDVGSVQASTSAGAPALDVPTGIAESLDRHGIVLDHVGACTGL